MSGNEIIFMRFRNEREGDEIHLVGCSEEAMRKDALLFGPFSEREAEGAIITHDDAASEADRRCFSSKIFKDGMHAASSGVGSYYLF